MTTKGCKVPGCVRLQEARGYCHVHYNKKRERIRHGLPSGDFLLSLNLKTKGARNAMWKGGMAEYPNHYLMKKIRKQVLEEANYTCQICGGQAREIHHKDKTKKNHSKENFLAVCHRCHAREFHRDVVGRPKGFVFDFDKQIDICYFYVTSEITIMGIARIFNSSHTTIRNILRAYSIPRKRKNNTPIKPRLGEKLKHRKTLALPKHRKMKRRRDFIVSKQLIPLIISKIGNIAYAK